MMITISTAECFTHGMVAREIHAYSQGYLGEFGPKYLQNIQKDVLLLCGMFIPTLTALTSILKVEPPKPQELIRGIKVYDELTDQKVAYLMARAVKDLTGAQVGIGTTAGIGRGAIVILSDEIMFKATSDVYADLRFPDSDLLLERQRSGVQKTLSLLVELLEVSL